MGRDDIPWEMFKVDGSTYYGSSARTASDAFLLSHLQRVSIDSRKFVFVRFRDGKSVRMFAFSLPGVQYAGEWPSDGKRLLADGDIHANARGLYTLKSAPSGYIDRLSFRTQEVTYGKPHELALLRSRLTPICTGGHSGPEIGPAYASELIQIGAFAIAEGSCGNPELHLALVRVHGVWQRVVHCGLGGGTIPNFGRFGLYTTLIRRCGFPIASAKEIIAVRAQQPEFINVHHQ